MFKYILKRIFLSTILVLIVVTIIFCIVRLAPGDPVIAILGDTASQETINALREELGLNEPLWKQYRDLLNGLRQFDLGESMITGIPISSQLSMALPFTIELTTAGMVLGILFGVPIGILSALYRNKMPDYITRLISLVGISVPSFYLSILLLYWFAVKIQIFPVVSSTFDNADFIKRIYNLTLPAITQGLIMTSFLMRMTRSSMLNVLNEDYIRTARGKGLSEKSVIFRHALVNALIPVVSVVGIYFIINLGSSVMTEIVFSRPGLGKLMVMAMKQRDYTMLQSVMIAYAFLSILINLGVDIAYSLIDPRIK